MPRMHARHGRAAATAPVLLEHVSARRDGKCRACHGDFAKGDPVLRIRLRKAFRSTTCSCGRRLPGLKYFHPTCAPSDPIRTMGGPFTGANTTNTPPPTARMSPQEAKLAALVAFEKALSLSVHKMTPEQKTEATTQFDKYRKLKALAIGAGATDAEAATALRMATIALVKIVM